MLYVDGRDGVSSLFPRCMREGEKQLDKEGEEGGGREGGKGGGEGRGARVDEGRGLD